MKPFIYLGVLTLTALSCGQQTTQPIAAHPETSTTVGDSLYKIGDFLFEAQKGTQFELVCHGQHPTGTTQGDTLYADPQVVLLGDLRAIGPSGIYKKFAFRSQFDQYKVDKIYAGRLASPKFSTDPAARLYKSSIQEGCKEKGVDFAGHYTITKWGCGTLCAKMAIVDRISGRIIYTAIPFDAADGHTGDDYRADSRMLIINTECLSAFDGYEPGYRRYQGCREPLVYEFKDGVFTRIE